MAKKNNIERISDPNELDKILKRTNPLVWIILGVIIVLLLNFFLWSFLATLELKIHLDADINNTKVVASADDTDLAKISVGQRAYINDMPGEVLSIESDGKIIISEMPLANGSYDCYVVVREIKPIEFLLEN